MSDDTQAIELLSDALLMLKTHGVDAPLTIERIKHYLEINERKSVIKPCPKCGSRTVSIGSQRLKMCTCGWKDTNWTLSKDQKPLYG